MTDRQKQEVLTWLQTHSAVTCHSLSHFLRLSLEETRNLLLAAIQHLGKTHFRLLYCLQRAGEDSLELVSAEDMMEVESEDMVLFAAQRRPDGWEGLHQAEMGLKGLRLGESLGEGRLEVHATAGIQPLTQEVRELLPHRKRKIPGLPTSAPKPESVLSKSQPCTSVLKPQPGKSKPVCKSQTTLKTTQRTVEPQTFSSPLAAAVQMEEIPSETKSTSPEDKQENRPNEGNRVTFSEDTNSAEHPVKRRSTPHPSKSKKQTDDLSEILKSSLYTVEEDDSETAATPAPILKRKQPDPPPRSAPQPSQASTAEKVPTEGLKRVKISSTTTFVDRKGYLVSKDVVNEEMVKTQSVPSKPAAEATIPHKKGKQMGLNSFFQKQ